MLGFLRFKSGHSQNYNISTEPAFHAGAWAVHNATRRQGGDLVSVFMFDKKKFEAYCSKNGMKSSHGSDEIFSRLRNEATNLARLRHPNFLRIIEPLYEGKSSLSFVTERVECCVRSMVEADASRESRPSVEHIPPELSNLAIQKGLLQLSEGLRFMHEDAKMVHMNINLNTVFVDSYGDWKLGGCGYASELDKSNNSEFFLPQYDTRYPRFVQLNLDFAAPELVLDKNLDFSADVFSLACFAITLYNFKPPIDSNNNYNNYQEDVGALASFFRKPNNTTKIPAALVEILPRMLTRYPTDRYPIQAVLSASFFNSFLLKALKFFDEFSGKTDEEIEAFIPQFIETIPEFPFEILKNKVLKVLIASLGHVTEPVMASLLHVIFLISAQLSLLDFCTLILPVFSGNEKLQQNSHVQRIVLNDLHLFLKHLGSKEIEKDILPFFFVMFDNSGTPEIQELALFKCQKDILEKLDFPVIKNKIFPKICEVFTKTTSLGVKIAAINALKELVVSGLDKYSVTEKLLGMLKGVKSRDPRVMMSMLSLYETLVAMLDIEVVANEVIPVLWSMAVGPKYSVAQFEQFMNVIKQFSTKVETEQKKKLTHNVEVPIRSQDNIEKPTNNFTMLDDSGPDFILPVSKPAAAPTVKPAFVSTPSVPSFQAPATIPALSAPKKANDDFGGFQSAGLSSKPLQPQVPSLTPLKPQPKPASTANYNINMNSANTTSGISWNQNPTSSGVNWNTATNGSTGSGINWPSQNNNTTPSSGINWNTASTTNGGASLNWNQSQNTQTNATWNASTANSNNSDSLL